MSRPIEQRRLIFVTGKGGVGKTAVASSLARALAFEGRRVLLVDLAPVSPLGLTNGVNNITYAPSQITNNLYVCRLTPGECMREYGLMKLKIRTIYDLVFENTLIKSLISLVPGLDELLLIGKIDFLVNSRQKAWGGSPEWDVVVVDAPPTGQGIGLLSMPDTILSAVKGGPLTRDVERIRLLLTDDSTTGIVLVTTPEQLAVDELMELESALTGLGLPLCHVVVNRRVPVEFSDEEAQMLASCVYGRRATQAFTWAYAVMSAGLAVNELGRRQTDEVRRLRGALGLPVTELPWLVASSFGPSQLDTLAVRLRPLLSMEVP